ncbi:MAG: hypothetical protein EPN82_17010 [Bacteroidetes bacterium]|nr:MAG: hypothetical protein EPN82_17010 [Bacteroidota bacterium]
MKQLIFTFFILLAVSCSDNSTNEPVNNVKRTYYHAYDYSRNYFLLDTSYYSIINDFYKLGYIPQSATPLRIKQIEVWESNNNLNDSSVTFIGIAFADLETKKYLIGERYNDSLLHIPPTSGIVEMSNFALLDSTKYTIDYNLGIIRLKDLKSDRYYAVSYRIEGETNANDDDAYYGTMKSFTNPGDTLILKLIYRPNLIPPYRTIWQRLLKNYYTFDAKGIDVNKTDVKLFYINQNNDTLDVLDSLPDKLVTIFGVDRVDNETGNPVPDGKFDLRLPYFDKNEGIIMLPSLQPFYSGIISYLQKINRTDLVQKYMYPEVYDKTYGEARSKTERDRYLIVVETLK